MTIKTLIVDDEELARRGIRRRLYDVPFVEVVGECVNGREAVASINELTPDLVFLDIQMPGMSGFEVLEQVMPSKSPFVIFVTAYDQHALEAFQVHALDYLLKPIDDTRFKQALEHVHQQAIQRKNSTIGQQFSSLLNGFNPGADRPVQYRERFIIKSGGRISFVKACDIVWIEAAGDYVCFHLEGKTYLLRETMSDMESKLDPRYFLRIHRSTIVNAEYIQELRSHANGEYRIRMSEGSELKSSRSYRRQLQQFFGSDL